MATAAEAIVLSSSPTLHTRTPARALNDSAQLLVVSPPDRTPPPSSPSERCPSRSRYFAESNVNTTKAKPKRQPAKKTDKLEQDETKTAGPKQKAKKDATGSASAILGDVEVGSIDSRDTVAKEPTAKKKATTTKKTTTAKKTGTRTKKAPESGNMKITGKVTKTSDTPAEDAKKPAKKPSAKGKTKAESAQPKDPKDVEESEHVKLDEAMARRRDWTPPRETLHPDDTAMDATDDASQARESGSFGKLLSDYGYAGLASDSWEAVLSGEAGGPTKRRRIEVCCIYKH